MNEKSSGWLDFSLKVIIALVVPVTIAVIGLVGEMIVSKAGENQQTLEIITRQAEAHTAFQRDLFSELFKKYVDEISVAEKPQHLDALATRLELLSSNFADFLKLQPLFQQLSRQIDTILPLDDQDSEVKNLRLIYQDRLVSSAKQVVEGQAASIGDRGETWHLQFTVEDLLSEPYAYQKDIVFDGIARYIEVNVFSVDMKRRQVRVGLMASQSASEGGGHYSVRVDSRFNVNDFSFPLEANTALSHNHRVAVSIVLLDDKYVHLRVQLFRHMPGYNLEALRERAAARE